MGDGAGTGGAAACSCCQSCAGGRDGMGRERRGWLRQERQGQGMYRTTFFQRLVRQVPAVSMGIAHFASVNALSTLTLKLAGTFAR